MSSQEIPNKLIKRKGKGLDRAKTRSAFLASAMLQKSLAEWDVGGLAYSMGTGLSARYLSTDSELKGFLFGTSQMHRATTKGLLTGKIVGGKEVTSLRPLRSWLTGTLRTFTPTTHVSQRIGRLMDRPGGAVSYHINRISSYARRYSTGTGYGGGYRSTGGGSSYKPRPGPNYYWDSATKSWKPSTSRSTIRTYTSTWKKWSPYHLPTNWAQNMRRKYTERVDLWEVTGKPAYEPTEKIIFLPPEFNIGAYEPKESLGILEGKPRWVQGLAGIEPWESPYEPEWARIQREVGSFGFIATTLAPSYVMTMFRTAYRAGWIPTDWMAQPEAGFGMYTYEGRATQAAIMSSIYGFKGERAELRELLNKMRAEEWDKRGDVEEAAASRKWADYYKQLQKYDAMKQGLWEARQGYFEFEQQWAPIAAIYGAVRLASFLAPQAFPIRAFGWTVYGPIHQILAAQAMGVGISEAMKAYPEETLQEIKSNVAFWPFQTRSLEESLWGGMVEWTLIQSGLWGLKNGLRGTGYGPIPEFAQFTPQEINALRAWTEFDLRKPSLKFVDISPELQGIEYVGKGEGLFREFLAQRALQGYGEGMGEAIPTRGMIRRAWASMEDYMQAFYKESWRSEINITEVMTRPARAFPVSELQWAERAVWEPRTIGIKTGEMVWSEYGRGAGRLWAEMPEVERLTFYAKRLEPWVGQTTLEQFFRERPTEVRPPSLEETLIKVRSPRTEIEEPRPIRMGGWGGFLETMKQTAAISFMQAGLGILGEAWTPIISRYLYNLENPEAQMPLFFSQQEYEETIKKTVIGGGVFAGGIVAGKQWGFLKAFEGAKVLDLAKGLGLGIVGGIGGMMAGQFLGEQIQKGLTPQAIDYWTQALSQGERYPSAGITQDVKQRNIRNTLEYLRENAPAIGATVGELAGVWVLPSAAFSLIPTAAAPLGVALLGALIVEKALVPPEAEEIMFRTLTERIKADPLREIYPWIAGPFTGAYKMTELFATARMEMQQKGIPWKEPVYDWPKQIGDFIQDYPRMLEEANAMRYPAATWAERQTLKKQEELALAEPFKKAQEIYSREAYYLKQAANAGLINQNELNAGILRANARYYRSISEIDFSQYADVTREGVIASFAGPYAPIARPNVLDAYARGKISYTTIGPSILLEGEDRLSYLAKTFEISAKEIETGQIWANIFLGGVQVNKPIPYEWTTYGAVDWSGMRFWDPTQILKIKTIEGWYTSTTLPAGVGAAYSKLWREYQEAGGKLNYAAWSQTVVTPAAISAEMISAGMGQANVETYEWQEYLRDYSYWARWQKLTTGEWPKGDWPTIPTPTPISAIYTAGVLGYTMPEAPVSPTIIDSKYFTSYTVEEAQTAGIIPSVIGEDWKYPTRLTFRDVSPGLIPPMQDVFFIGEYEIRPMYGYANLEAVEKQLKIQLDLGLITQLQYEGRIFEARRQYGDLRNVILTSLLEGLVSPEGGLSEEEWAAIILAGKIATGATTRYGEAHMTPHKLYTEIQKLHPEYTQAQVYAALTSMSPKVGGGKAPVSLEGRMAARVKKRYSSEDWIALGYEGRQALIAAELESVIARDRAYHLAENERHRAALAAQMAELKRQLDAGEISRSHYERLLETVGGSRFGGGGTRTFTGEQTATYTYSGGGYSSDYYNARNEQLDALKRSFDAGEITEAEYQQERNWIFGVRTSEQIQYRYLGYWTDKPNEATRNYLESRFYWFDDWAWTKKDWKEPTGPTNVLSQYYYPPWINSWQEYMEWAHPKEWKAAMGETPEEPKIEITDPTTGKKRELGGKTPLQTYGYDKSFDWFEYMTDKYPTGYMPSTHPPTKTKFPWMPEKKETPEEKYKREHPNVLTERPKPGAFEGTWQEWWQKYHPEVVGPWTPPEKVGGVPEDYIKEHMPYATPINILGVKPGATPTTIPTNIPRAKIGGPQIAISQKVTPPKERSKFDWIETEPTYYSQDEKEWIPARGHWVYRGGTSQQGYGWIGGQPQPYTETYDPYAYNPAGEATQIRPWYPRPEGVGWKFEGGQWIRKYDAQGNILAQFGFEGLVVPKISKVFAQEGYEGSVSEPTELKVGEVGTEYVSVVPTLSMTSPLHQYKSSETPASDMKNDPEMARRETKRREFLGGLRPRGEKAAEDLPYLMPWIMASFKTIAGPMVAQQMVTIMMERST